MQSDIQKQLIDHYFVGFVDIENKIDPFQLRAYFENIIISLFVYILSF